MDIFWLAILLHVLFWGAAGAAFGPRAGLRPWLAAVISIVAPVLGVIVLAGLAFRNVGASGGRVPVVLVVGMSVLGVVGSAMVVASGWMSWIDAGLTGGLGDVLSQDVRLASTDSLGLEVVSTVLGGTIAVLVLIATVTARRVYLPAVVVLAWVPAALGALAIGANELIEPWLETANNAGLALATVADEDVDFSGSVSMGNGPMLALAGGVIVLIWGLAWGLVAPSREHRANASQAAVGGYTSPGHWPVQLGTPHGAGHPAIEPDLGALPADPWKHSAAEPAWGGTGQDGWAVPGTSSSGWSDAPDWGGGNQGHPNRRAPW